MSMQYNQLFSNGRTLGHSYLFAHKKNLLFVAKFKQGGSSFMRQLINGKNRLAILVLNEVSDLKIAFDEIT